MALVSHRLEYYKLIIIFFLFLKTNDVTSLAPPEQPSIQFFQETPTEGQLVTIACTVQNVDPNPSLIWYRDNIEVNRQYSTQESATHNMYSFVVLREYHNSEFKCVAKNSQGEKFATKKFIDIYVKTSEPVISGPNNVPENTAYTWTCVTTRGHPKPTVKWMREGSYVATATENEDNNDDGTVNITATYKYTPTKSNNGDVLTCLVSEEKTITGNGNLTSSITWNIYYAPDQPTMTGFPDRIGIAGTQSTFKCQITEGNPAPSITWYRGSTQITTGVTHQAADRTSTLQYTLQADDVDVIFKCTATNSQGSMSANNSMSDVYVAPEKPILSGFPTAIPVEGDQISLSCSSKSGNPPPKVYWYRGDDTNPKDDTYTVDGSKNIVMNNYTFSIHHDDKNVPFKCEAENDVAKVSESQSINEIYVRPVLPSVGGPQVVYEDKQETWQCNSTRGYKQQTLTWRLNGLILPTFHSSQKVDIIDNGIYRVFKTLKYTPKPEDHLKNLTCTVEHDTLSTPIAAYLTLTVHAKPTLSIKPSTDNVEVGKDYTISCNVTSSLDYNVTWYKTDTNGLLASSDNKYVMGQNTLTIKNFQVADNGNYLCRSENLAGLSHSYSNNITLTAFAYPGAPVIAVFPNDVIEGKVINITCTSSGGIPTPDLSWRKDTTLVHRTTTTSPPVTTNTYQFAPVFEDKDVTFKCVANNGFGPALEESKKFSNVYVTPENVTLSGPTDVYEANSATWWCNVSRSNPAPDVNWRLDNDVFSTGISTKVTNDDGTLAVMSSLTYLLKSDDVGKTIYCEVEHPKTLESKMIDNLTLSVFLLPRVYISPTIVHAEISKSISLQCSVTSVKKYDVIWYKNSKQIATDSTRHSFTSDNMNILKVDKNDSAVYACQATNIAGSSQISNNVTLYAYALPGVPVITDFPATAVEGKDLQVNCTSVGGVPPPNVTWYRQSDIKDVTWITIGETTFNEYTFKVAFADKGAIFSCVSQNAYTDPTLKKEVKFDQVFVRPNDPVLKGPSIVYESNLANWTCIGRDGFPLPSVHWRIGEKDLTLQATRESYQETRGTFSMNSSLSYSPTKEDVGQTLYCEVKRIETITGNISVNIPLTVYLIPRVSLKSTPDHVKITIDHTIKCNVVSELETTIYWYKDGTEVTEKEGKYVLSTDQLTIKNVTTADGGSYTCSSSNKAGHSTKSNALQLIPYALPETPILVGFPDTVLVGKTYNLTCTSTGAVPAANITWSMDGVLADQTWTTTKLTTTNTFEWNATFEDRKVNFTCIAQNAYGAFFSSKTLTAVYVTPSPQVISGSSVVYETKPSSWWCNTTSGYPEATLTWRLGNTDITNLATKTAVVDDTGTIGVYSALTYTLTKADVGKTLYCDMEHTWTLQSKLTKNISLTVHLRPTAAISDARVDVEIGKTTTFQCTVVSTIDYQVTWYKNGDIVTNDASIYRFEKNSLTILSVKVLDEGQYNCKVSNLAGSSTLSSAVQLIAYSFVGQPKITSFPKTATEGSTIQLICQSDGGRPAPNVTWYRNNVKQEGDTTTNGTVITTLLTFNTHFNDRLIKYKCVAENSYKTFSVEEAFDDIYVTPSDPVITGDAIVYESIPITFICNYTRAYPNAVIMWRYGDKDITSQAKQYFTKNADNPEISDSYSNITYTPVSSDVGKILYCDVSHSTLTTKKTTSKTITVYLIPRVSINVNTVHIEITKDYKFTCSVVSLITFDVKWYKDGKVIEDKNTEKYYVEPVSLNIKSVDTSDDANYTCTATNKAGTSTISNTARLIAYTKPIVPTLVGFPISSIEGNTVALNCTSSVGVPTPSLQWYINDTLLNVPYYVSSTGAVRNDYAFTANFNDRYNLYKCIAKNEYGNRTIEARINTVYVMPVEPSLTGQSIVYESNSVTWLCNVTRSYPKPVFKWMVGTKDHSHEAISITETNSDQTKSSYSSLTYTPTNSDVGKTVYCNVQHSETDRNLTASMLLTVYLIPRVSITPTEAHVEIGSNHTIRCQVVSEGIASTAEWYKGSSTNPLLPDSNKYKIQNPSLQILSVQTTDEATYTCRAKNKAGTSASSNAQKVVAYAFPGEAKMTGFPKTVVAGDSLTLICSSSGGVPVPSVQWFKDDDPVPNPVITTDAGVVRSTVTFTVAFADRKSVYKCVAKNTYKTRSAEVQFESVYLRPLNPALTSPSHLYESVGDTWWCNSSRSFPESKLTWRLGNTDMNSYASFYPVTNDNGTITVNSRLDYTPKKEDQDKILYCEIEHDKTLSKKLTESVRFNISFIPTITITTITSDVKIGSTKTIENKIVSDIAYNVTWFFKGKIITIDNSKYKLQDNNLVISNFLVSDNGDYTCTASNYAGTSQKSNSIALSGFSTPLTPEISGIPDTIIEGQQVTLNCTCKEGIPLPTLTWYRGDKIVDSTAMSNVDGSTSFSYNDYTFKVHHDDKNVKYRCTANNKFLDTPVYNESSIKIIYVTPYQPVFDGESVVHEDNSYSWVCETTRAQPSPTISWKLGIKNMIQGVSQVPKLNTDLTVSMKSTLVYAPVKGDDGKVLSCIISHQWTLNSPIYLNKTLSVTLKPVVSTTPSSSKVEVGNTVNITCEVTSSLTYNVTWYKQGISEPLTDQSKYRTDENKISILNSALSDAGKYYCIARSAAGSSLPSSSSQVNPFISPGQPVISGIPQEVKEHTTLTINCSSTGGNPAPTLTLYRNDVPVEESHTSQGSSATTVWKAYTFNVKFNDRQLDYKCVADNTYTAVSNKGSIQNVYVPPTQPIIIGPSPVVAGRVVKWSGQIQRTYPIPDTSWFIGSVPLTAGIENKYVKAKDEDTHSVVSDITYYPKADDNGAFLNFTVDHSWTSTKISATKKIEVYFSPDVPVITKFDKTSINGTQMTAVCTVTGGNPKPAVYWYRNGVLVDKEYSSASDGSPVVNEYKLTVRFIEKNAVFKCIANNTEFEVEKEIKYDNVNVIPTGPVFDGPVDLIAGNEYTWTCDVTNSYPVPVIEWRLNSLTMTTKTDLPTSRTDGTYDFRSTLKYTPVGDDNGKVLYCLMTHAETSTSKTLMKNITVHVEPTVDIKPSSVDVVVNKDAVFTCNVMSTKPHNTTWFKVGDTDTIIKDDGNKYDIDGDVLTIKKVQESDEGKFYCVSSSIAGKSKNSNTVELEVISAPGEPAINNFELKVKNGTTMTVTCTTTGGDPPPDVVWYKDGVVVDSEYTRTTGADNVSITNNTYTFTALFKDRNSNYTCNATNAVTTHIKTKSFTNLYVPPSDPVFSGPTETTENVETSWTCTISQVYPSGTIAWSKGGEKLSNGNGFVISGTTQKNKVNDDGTHHMVSKITFSPVALDNFKFLTCEIAHPETKANLKSEENITVYYVFHSVIPSVKEENVAGVECKAGDAHPFGALHVTTIMFGATFTNPVITGFPNISTEGRKEDVTCSVRGGYPYPTLSWYRNGLEMDNSYESTYDGVIRVTTNKHTISVTREEVEKTYVCRAKSSKYELETDKKFNDIYVEPADITLVAFEDNLMENIKYNWTCRTSRVYKEPVIEWTLGSEKLNAKSPITTKNQDGTFSVVSVFEHPPTEADKGKTLTCKINHTDTSKELEKSISLVVHVKPKVSVLEKVDINALIGGTSTMTCVVQSSLNPTTVKWYKKNGNSNTPVIASSKFVMSGSLLVIKNIMLADDGQYFCTATSQAGTSDNSDMVNLTVYTSPQGQTTISSTTNDIKESDTIEANCSANVNPATNVKYYWYFGQTFITTSFNLKIENAGKQYNGEFRCIANNSIGSGEAKFKVNVKYIPQPSVPTRSYKNDAGSLTTLSCDMLANPSPTLYEWYVANEKLSITSVKYELQTKKGTTTYKCYATNAMGRSSALTFTVVGEDSGAGSQTVPKPSTAETEGISSAAIAAIVLSMVLLVLLIITGIYCFFSRPEKKVTKSSVEPYDDDLPPKELPPPFDPHRRFVEQFPPPKPWHTPRRHHALRDLSGLRMDTSTVSRGDITVNYGNRKPYKDPYETSLRPHIESEVGTFIDGPQDFYYGRMPHNRLAPLNRSLTYDHEEKLRKKRRKQKKKVKRSHQTRESGEGMESPQKDRKLGGGNSPTEKKILIDDDEVVENTEVNLGSQFN